MKKKPEKIKIKSSRTFQVLLNLQNYLPSNLIRTLTPKQVMHVASHDDRNLIITKRSSKGIQATSWNKKIKINSLGRFINQVNDTLILFLHYSLEKII